ncbi:non-ribosomal peptide synthetase [Streptomyces sp. NBC_00102]|uniref:non-ribosomal peptide synthetase n=1 Tax=Streptomyces sp. NBC_00102 TaxID=2975652 RepID=UPI002254DE81|nr:non-ribosomal peptide synthetase [Streptomyces sp. NBC_00102]MCX5395500.1 amino acid adenylation domain-containing protein [Streptomyces sp. NBC_00102]
MNDLTDRIASLPVGKRAELRELLWERGIPTAALRKPDEAVPASFTQRRLAFLQELTPDSAAYNSPMSCRLTGPLDPVALEGALNDVLVRQAVLRTSLPVRDGVVVQHVNAHTPRELPVTDLTGLGAEAARAESIRLAELEQQVPFDLASGPLVRFHLLLVAEQEAVLLLTFHHAVFDGWSISVFVQDVAHCYEARSCGRAAALAPLGPDYAEYARWQQEWVESDEAKAQLDYWVDRLAGAPELLSLPLDHRRPARPSTVGASVRVLLPPSVRDALADLAARSGCTLFMVLLAAFQITLSRYSGQQDIVVGTPVAARRSGHLQNLVGFFANSVALRSEVDPQLPFGEFLKQVRETCLAAYDHQDMPLDLLAQRLHPERDLGRNPLYQVNFTLHNTPEPVDTVGGLTLSPLTLDLDAARFDLDLNVWDGADGLDCQLIHAVDLFDGATAERVLESLRVLVDGVLADPAASLASLPVTAPAATAGVAAGLYGAETARPADMRVHRLFGEQVRRTPDAIAVSSGLGEMTYAELDAASDRAAARLTELGVRGGTTTAVRTRRSPALVVALLGILKAGGAYLPVDPGHPASRTEQMLQDSGAVLVVTEDGGEPLAGLPTVAAAALSAGTATVGARPAPGAAGDDADIMYLIYTSGSTGIPKAAVLSHRQVANYLLWAADTFDAAGGSGVPVHSSIGFDLTVTSLFAPLLSGQRLVLLDEEGAPGEALVRSAESARDLSFVKLTPSHLKLLEDAADPDRDAPWSRIAVIGGEDLREEQVAAWRAGGTIRRLFNEYGPTETAVACAAHEDDGRPTPSGAVPIGRPIPHTQLYVLDPLMNPVPVGAPGELHVGGAGVSYGYWKRPELTAERFVPDPFKGGGARLYRTGDLARVLRDGSLEYLGRLDDQVKIRGHRIELGEVTSVLSAMPGVRQALVEVDRRVPGNAELVAFLEIGPEDPGPADRGDSADGLLDRWRDLYQDTYADLGASPGADPSFNLAGWTSSYTGGPIDPSEMSQWLDSTVHRITALEPRHALEIGCGTGMILSRVAPACETFHGTDQSAPAIQYVRDTVVPAVPVPDGAVSLAAAPAHRSIRAGRRYDTVVLNSVVQYFPSAEYLREVLTQAVSALSEGGRVFVGDVRSLGLLEAFHASVLAHRAQPGTKAGRLRAELRRQVALEPELCLDPGFFHGLRETLPRITGVSVLPKRGRYDNELSVFRYDVVLTVDGAPRPAPAGTDWSAAGMDLAALEKQLSEGGPADGTLAFSGVPNARTRTTIAFRDALAHALPQTPVEEVRARAEDATGEAGVHPEDLWELAERYGIEAGVTWDTGSADGSFDVVLRRPAGERAGSPAPAHATGTAPARRTTANEPLWQARSAARISAVEERAREILPPALVPARFLPLPQFPLTRNGKVDRAELRQDLALTVGRTTGQAPAVEPLTPTEVRIAAIWTELLGRDGIRSDSDFFNLGGHSLLSFQLVSRLREEFGADVPIRAPFEAPVLRDLGRMLDGLGVTDPAPRTPALPPLVPVPRTQRTVPSFAQERMWFTTQLDPESRQYNYGTYLRLTGTLHIGHLEHALNQVTGRHEVLRTLIRSDEGVAYQMVLPQAPATLPVLDLTGLPDDLRERVARRLAREQYDQRIDLAHPPVVRVNLLRLAADEHVLLLTTHHIALDGWSVGLLVCEITECYAALCEGRPHEPAVLPVQYADYAVWQRSLRDGGQYDRMLSYWRTQLDGILSLPAVPLDRPRPAGTAHRGGTLPFRIDEAVADRLRALCKEEDITLFMAFLAVTHTLLAELTDGTDVVVGADVAGRSDAAVENLIGFFVNQVVLRGDLSGEPTWLELLRRTKALTVDAYAHQDLPFEDVVKALNPRRGSNQSPLFQLKLTLDNTPQHQQDLPGLEVEPFVVDIADTSRFDLTVRLREDRAGIDAFWEYDAELFEESTVQRMQRRFVELVGNLTSEPGSPAVRAQEG